MTESDAPKHLEQGWHAVGTQEVVTAPCHQLLLPQPCPPVQVLVAPRASFLK